MGLSLGKLIFLAVLALPLAAAYYYAHPDGSGTACTFAAPCTLATGIGASSPVGAGDTLWVMGQTCHAGLHTNALEGTSEAPVTVKAYPGHRACVDLSGVNGYAFRIHTGTYTRWIGLEFLDSNPPRRDDVTHASGVEIQAPNAVLALSKIHDVTGTALAFWQSATDSSLVGNLLWGNGGWSVAQTRWYGHNIYTQHEDLASSKYIHSQMWNWSMNTSWRLGGTNARPRYVNFDVRDGVYLSRDDQFDPGSTFTGWTFDGNHFIRPDFTASSLALQLSETGPNAAGEGTLVFDNNYMIGFYPHLRFFANLTARGNTHYSPTRSAAGTASGAWYPAGGTAEAFTALVREDNRYVKDCDSGAGCYKYSITENSTLSYVTAADATDPLAVTRASLTTPEIIYDTRPGTWETGRCHVVIYNWGGASSVNIDLGECGFAVNDYYEIHDLQDLNAGAVQSGRYGATVPVNVAYAGVSQPVNGDAVVAAGAASPFAYTRIDPLVWAGVVRKRWDGRAETTLAWRGAETDTLEAGYLKPDASITWGELPVTQIACADGRCRAKVPQALGNAWWRINGGPELKMAAR